MERASYDFGSALAVDAEAIGQPGQRRFRLLVRSSSQTASIWMEKQQLEGIGAWLEEVIEKLDAEQPNSDPDVEPTPFDDSFDVEFRASQIGLGYAEEEALFAIQAFDMQAAGASPVFRCNLTRGQCRVLARKIETVVSGGRPICPLCDTPIDPSGHVCPKANGHHRVGV